MNMGTHPALNKECTDEVHMDVVDLEGEDIVVIVEAEAVTKKDMRKKNMEVPHTVLVVLRVNLFIPSFFPKQSDLRPQPHSQPLRTPPSARSSPQQVHRLRDLPPSCTEASLHSAAATTRATTTQIIYAAASDTSGTPTWARRACGGCACGRKAQYFRLLLCEPCAIRVRSYPHSFPLHSTSNPIIS
jgi:hypothetical protein